MVLENGNMILKKGTVLCVIGLAGDRCRIEGKHCVVVLVPKWPNALMP